MRFIDLNELLSAFSLALDVAENKTFEHAQRTAYIALKIAQKLELPEEQLRNIYSAALLHDIGKVNAAADPHFDQTLAAAHCFEGSEIVKSLPFSNEVSEFIYWHHANWNGIGPFERAGNDIPLGSQIVYISDQLDVRLKALTDIYADRGEILDYVLGERGNSFRPDVVDAFRLVQEKESFWLDYNHYNLAEVLSAVQPKNSIFIDLEGLEKIALAFAKIIDNKSPFTRNHSQGVSELVFRFGEHCQLDNETIHIMKISGLLHDLGKLAISNDILDKPGKLTPLEFSIIKSHSYFTKRILSKVKGFELIKEWAGNHHETMDGSGYPEGINNERLSIPERMMGICDIYQALTEERPYRSTLPQSKAFEIIQEQVQNGKLCPETFCSFKTMMA